MKTAIVPRASLASALAVVKDVIEKRNTIPVLSNVRLVARDGVMIATGTDLDIATSVTIPGTVADQDFGVTIPAHMMHDLIRKAPNGDEIAIDAETSGKVQNIGSGTTHEYVDSALDFGGLRIKTQGISPRDFPEMELTGERVEFDIATADFRAGLEAVALAISSEETRYYLCGIYMHTTEAGALRMVATDGHRLGKHDIAGPFPACHGVIIPRKTVSHLLKVTGKGAPETMRVIVNTAKVRFVVGNVDVVSKLIDGTFPDYQRVIPRDWRYAATFNRKAMIEAIKAVGVISSERGRAIKWESFADGTDYRWEISVNNPDIGEARFPVPGVTAELNGAEFSGFHVGMNMTYALDLLQAMDSETVTIRFTDYNSPMQWTAGDFADSCNPETLYVLMPMRV